VRALSWVTPSEAAHRFVAMRPATFVATVTLAILAVPTTVSFLGLLGNTVTYDWTRGGWTTTTGPAGSPPVYRQPPVIERSIAEVWREWHAGPGISPIVIIFLVATPLAIGWLASMAFVLVPDVHADEPWSAAFGRSARVAVASLIVFLHFFVGMSVVSVTHARMRSGANIGPPVVEFIVISTTLAALVAWTVGAARSARPPMPAAAIPPRCEMCGYDLTHVPDNGLCPECGLDASYSLRPGAARPGAAFDRAAGRAAWLESTQALLFNPTRFYRTLTLRDGCDRADRFALWHYVAIGLGAWSWMFICLGLSSFVQDFEWLFLPVLVAFLALLAGWGTHRLVAAIVAAAWILRRELPSSNWLRKIIRCETAYLWAFCLFNGAAITFGMFWEDSPLWRDFIRRFLRDALGGLPPEPILILAGNGVLIVLWLWRYRLALHNSRWANF
jgi:hypothetical protein